jgi:hypothetical protein
MVIVLSFLKAKMADLTKEFSFLPNTYEVLVKDSSDNGVGGKPFASAV